MLNQFYMHNLIYHNHFCILYCVSNISFLTTSYPLWPKDKKFLKITRFTLSQIFTLIINLEMMF